MDKLTIKNFGPIKDISIDVNDINIFIGPTSSGKSTVAKLIAIFTDSLFIEHCSLSLFTKLIEDNNINFEITNDTEIIYSVSNSFWQIKNKEFQYHNNIQYKADIIIDFDSIYFSLPPHNDPWFENNYGNGYKKLLNQYVLEHDIPSDFSFSKEDFHEVLKKEFGNIYKNSKKEISLYNSIYISAERMLLSSIGESLFGLMKNDVSIAESLKEFGSLFETARKNLKSFDIPFLQAKYEYSEKNNYLTLSDGVKVKLEAASSGFQSLVPLMLVIEYFSNNKRLIDNCFVVEEPELNLYPSMQRSLVEFILSKVSQSNDRLIITTHSPYTLTAIDNLIQAKNAFEKHPELKEEINKAVPENLWIDFNKVSCYYFEDGYCRSTLDYEDQSIGPSNIDDVSEKLGETFDRLLELKYHD